MKYYRFIILCVLMVASTFAAHAAKIKLMTAGVKLGKNLPSDALKKIDAAFALAASQSGAYEIVFAGERDSAIKVIKAKKGSLPTPEEIAKALGVKELAFIKADRFTNMIRAEIILKPTIPIMTGKIGVGYSFINFHEKATDKEILDPAIIEAMQRALVNSGGADSLFARTAVEGFPLELTKTLAIGGVAIPPSEGKKRNWDIFQKPVVISYDAAETIFEEASKNPKFVAFDLATRDSMFAFYNMYGVENYMKTTEKEIEAFRKFGIEYFIGGNIIRQEEGASVELFLYKIEGEKVVQVSSAKESIYKDSIEDLRSALKRLTKKILINNA